VMAKRVDPTLVASTRTAIPACIPSRPAWGASRLPHPGHLKSRRHLSRGTSSAALSAYIVHYVPLLAALGPCKPLR